MARHTRPRPEEPQSAPVPEAEAKKPSKHREPDATRKQPSAAAETRPSHRNPFKSTSKRTPEKRKHSDRTTASVSGIFKSHRKGQDKKSRRRKEKTPELLVALEDGLDEARYAISEKTHITFEEVHAKFTQRIEDLGQDDKHFYCAVEEKAKLLSAALVEEEVQTIVRQKDGSMKPEKVFIGDRVTAFKLVIDTEEEKLKKLWRQWDEMQEEYLKLGVEVFGPEKFVEGAAIYRDMKGGYAKDMEVWEVEHGTAVDEIEDNIEEIGVRILQKLRNTEKSLDATAKKEQARLLQSIME